MSGVAYLPGRLLSVALWEGWGPCRREPAHRGFGAGYPPGKPRQEIPTPPCSTALWIRRWKPILVSIPCSTAIEAVPIPPKSSITSWPRPVLLRSMSRVGKCIDNGPMEDFWGILKREHYYGRRFTSREQLVRMIQDYIVYYNFRRLQRSLGVRTPMEVHDCLQAA